MPVIPGRSGNPVPFRFFSDGIIAGRMAQDLWRDEPHTGPRYTCDRYRLRAVASMVETGPAAAATDDAGKTGNRTGMQSHIGPDFPGWTPVPNKCRSVQEFLEKTVRNGMGEGLSAGNASSLFGSTHHPPENSRHPWHGSERREAGRRRQDWRAQGGKRKRNRTRVHTPHCEGAAPVCRSDGNAGSRRGHVSATDANPSAGLPGGTGWRPATRRFGDM